MPNSISKAMWENINKMYWKNFYLLRTTIRIQFLCSLRMQQQQLNSYGISPWAKRKWMWKQNKIKQKQNTEKKNYKEVWEFELFIWQRCRLSEPIWFLVGESAFMPLQTKTKWIKFAEIHSISRSLSISISCVCVCARCMRSFWLNKFWITLMHHYNGYKICHDDDDSVDTFW